MKNEEKVKLVLGRILVAFESGDVPEALSIAVLPRFDVPSSKWSISNRMLLFFSGTSDARGFRQWKEAGRWPKKGSKAIYILSPTHRKKIDKATDEEKFILTGFLSVPVFPYEQTEGKPIEQPELEPKQLPALHEVAAKWGIAVSYESFQGDSLGYFSPGRKGIVLATHDEQVFFHELAHAAHEKVKGSLKGTQDWKQEVVAELCSATLAHLYGLRINDGHAYQYIRHYAEKAQKDVYRACLSVISDVGKCLELITIAAQEDQAGISAGQPQAFGAMP
jgi:hypothetical protein